MKRKENEKRHNEFILEGRKKNEDIIIEKKKELINIEIRRLEDTIERLRYIDNNRNKNNNILTDENQIEFNKNMELIMNMLEKYKKELHSLSNSKSTK